MGQNNIVKPAQAREWVQKGEAVIVDVRERGEFDAEHISGAICHPVSGLNIDALRKEAGDRRIIFQCASGNRAGQACARYAEAVGGNDNAYLLDGSLSGWKQAGLPVEKGDGPLPLERQVLVAAGGLVLLGFLIPGMQWFSALVGAGMVFAGLTGNCMLKKILLRLPYNRAAS